MKILLASLFFFYACVSFAYEREFVVTDIVSDRTIQIQQLDPQIIVNPGDLFVIYSHETKQVLGYARVYSITDNSNLFIAVIETHNKSGLIRVENYLKKLDLTKADNDFPARYDLSYKDESKVAAKYRPLVYAGLVQGMTAANLTKKEFLIGPSIFSYGLTSGIQLNTSLVSAMFGVANLSVKNKIVDNDDFEISVDNGFQYYYKTRKGSYQFNGYLDMASVSNFKSYAKLKIFTQKPQDDSLSNNEEYLYDLNVEFQLSYGYMFNNWNQLIFGPKIDVNKKRIGGNVGYYIIDKNFNSMFGVSSNDFSEFRLGKQSYLINLDFWWRF